MGFYAQLNRIAITPGTGAAVQKGARVTVHAKGRVCNDKGELKEFWSTRSGNPKPFTYNAGIGQVIQGWDLGVLGMKLGEVAEIHIPAHQGYGAGGFPAWGIPPNADLNFEIEVIKIE